LECPAEVEVGEAGIVERSKEKDARVLLGEIGVFTGDVTGREGEGVESGSKADFGGRVLLSGRAGEVGGFEQMLLARRDTGGTKSRGMLVGEKLLLLALCAGESLSCCIALRFLLCSPIRPNEFSLMTGMLSLLLATLSSGFSSSLRLLKSSAFTVGGEEVSWRSGSFLPLIFLRKPAGVDEGEDDFGEDFLSRVGVWLLELALVDMRLNLCRF
jgi:hypothetical protein